MSTKLGDREYWDTPEEAFAGALDALAAIGSGYEVTDVEVDHQWMGRWGFKIHAHLLVELTNSTHPTFLTGPEAEKNGHRNVRSVNRKRVIDAFTQYLRESNHG